MQTQFNLLFQHPAVVNRQAGSLYEARDQGMGTVCMRSLTSGIFQKWNKWVRPDDDFDYNPALLQFQLSNPLINVVLVGMRTPGEVDQNIRILNDKAGRIDLDDLHNQRF
jgi:hypothetical protein